MTSRRWRARSNSTARAVALLELPVPDHGADEARRATAEVLAREEYDELRPGLLDRLWSAVLDALGRLIDLLGQTGQAGMIGSVILLAALAVLAYAVVRLLRRIRHSPAADEPRIGFEGRSAVDWMAEARAHEEASRWRQAARCHHRALVAELAAAGLLEEVPGRTAAEYEAEVARSAPDATEPMSRATRVFERAWYADVAVGPDDLEDLHRAAAEVRRATGLRVPAEKT